ncbi:MAG: hypothetical protein ABJ308_02215 [Halieaceae bacterium]
MNKNYLLAVLCGFSVLAVITVNANQPVATVESCGGLLPAGHVFEFDIVGTIDTTGAETDFQARIGLSENSGQNAELGDAIGPFVECVSAVLK